MAEATLSHSLRFPNGTSVSAYPESNWPGGVVQTNAAPPGSAVDTQTMTGSSLTFTGLDPGTRYIAYAEVNERHVYVGFSVSASAARPLALTTGWTPFGASGPTYYRDRGRVYIEGAAIKGATGTTILGTLPVGYRPASQRLFMARNSATTSVATQIAQVNSDGTVGGGTQAEGNVCFLDGISFLVT